MLSKLKVLSFTHYLQGPSSTQILGDLGADVLKIEALKGAFERSWSGPRAFKNGISVFHTTVNRNVGSLAIDLKAEEGKKIVYELIKEYDIVVENFRPGVMNKLGFSYEELSKRNPRVIYCSCSGYGPDGPYVDKPGQDILAQAMSGLMSVVGYGSETGPVPVGTTIVDQHGASLAALGIIAAAFSREQTGKGMRVDATLLNAAMDLQMETMGYFLNAEQTLLPEQPATGLSSRMNGSPYGVYKTVDGYLTISLNTHENLIKIFDPGVLDGFAPSDNIDRRVEYDKVVTGQFRKRTTAEWVKLLEENKMWYTTPNTYAEALNHPQVQHNKIVISYEHPTAGTINSIGHPLRYNGKGPGMRRPPPKLGEDTMPVLTKLGYSENQIKALKEQGIINWE